jgi:hypothetical protein
MALMTNSKESHVWQAEAVGPPHGYGVARHIEQTGGNRLAINDGTLYPGHSPAVLVSRK